jgi:hypothetical protein
VPLSDASTVVLATPTAATVVPTAAPATPTAATVVPGAPLSPRRTSWWPIAGAALAAVWVLALAVWAFSVFRSGATTGDKSAAAGAVPIAPATAAPDAAAAPTASPTADTSAAPATETQPVQPSAFTGPPPAVPSLWIECAGSQDVCGPLSLAFELTIESERLPAADRADHAEIALAIRTTTAQDREQKPGGLMWERTYSVVVECRAPRFGSAVPMPPPRTLNFDSHFGRDAAMDAGRALAREAVVRIRDFWRARASR